MVPRSSSTAGIAFGRYRLFVHRRELLCDDEPIKLGDRALDVLMVLIETPGTLIGKDELMARVWPNRAVEEGNLQAQITALRKALGSDRELIRTVAGRGYLLRGRSTPYRRLVISLYALSCSRGDATTACRSPTYLSLFLS
jgi:DNA-binding winged helix-turn-helix (wHTH) protein